MELTIMEQMAIWKVLDAVIKKGYYDKDMQTYNVNGDINICLDKADFRAMKRAYIKLL